jgi:hypothetical protein
MVRGALTLSAVVLVILACRSELSFPPRLTTGAVSDTARLITALPDSGPVYVSKNGHRVFDLAAIVSDPEDADSTIRWSLTAGPSLEVKLDGDTARIGPIPNQVCTSYVVFTATDPGGLSSSRTCPISVFEFALQVDSIAMSPNSTASTVLDFAYRPEPGAGLVWNDPQCDSTWLPECLLADSAGAKVLRLRAGDSVGITGIYLKISDPVNNVSFSHSIQVTVR